MSNLNRVLMVAGGTGGHVFPGLVIAQALREQGTDVHWLGTPTGIEAERVPQANIPMTLIKIKGLRGMGWRRMIRAPIDVLNAVMTSLKLLRTYKPDVVCGFGGFAAGPAGIACLLTRTPLVIHEQNAVAGFTNRVLAYWAKAILLGLPQVPGHKHALMQGELVGNPLRPALYHIPLPAERFNGRTGPLRILVLGGSQGAVSLNALIPAALKQLHPHTLIGQGVEVWHQVGPQHLASAQENYRDLISRCV